MHEPALHHDDASLPQIADMLRRVAIDEHQSRCRVHGGLLEMTAGAY
jgi:hypothetical protein